MRLSLLLMSALLALPAAANPSRFGLDYVFPLDAKYQKRPYARLYQEVGVKWVNFADLRWKWIEPHPPWRGKHEYKWEDLDAAVKHWQQHGFDITLTIRTGNAWFSGPSDFMDGKVPPVVRLMIKQSDRMPKPEHMDSFRAFIRAFVERYDGDGRDDMPGLLRPILHYQIGNEYGNPAFWTGSVEQYMEFLREASKAAKSACDEALILPSGLRTNDVFHDDPNAERMNETVRRFEERLENDFYIVNWRRARRLDEEALRLEGVIDLVDAGGNGSWHTTSEGYYRYVRTILDEAGNADIPIWDMEARNEPLLVPLETTHTRMELGIPSGKELLSILMKRKHPQHLAVKTWYHEEQARITAKVFVTKFAAGFEKVFMGMPMDWDAGIGAFSWPNPFMGFVDSARKPKPWPAYHTLKFLTKHLDGFTSATKVSIPGPVVLYRFDFAAPRKRVWVAWLEESPPRAWDTSPPWASVTLPILPERALPIPLCGRPKQTAPFEQAGNAIKLDISTTPVLFLEAAGE